MKYTKAEQSEAREKLLKWLQPGDTVYTVLEHVSRSGMQREIRVIIAKTDDDGQPYHLHPNYAVAALRGDRVGKRNGIVVDGCGKDMGFSIVYNLSATLFPDGFKCIGKKKRCPSNDHSNGDKRRHHWDGGYALRHQWL